MTVPALRSAWEATGQAEETQGGAPIVTLFSAQAQPTHSELVRKVLGSKATFSPIVTLEPRRRKFHKPITMTIPVPKAASDAALNGFGGDAPTLRLLCSITGESREGASRGFCSKLGSCATGRRRPLSHPRRFRKAP